MRKGSRYVIIKINKTQRKRAREKRRTKQPPDRQKTIKIAIINLSLLVIILNVNEWNAPIKGQRLVKLIF